MTLTEEQVAWAARKYLNTGAEPRDLYGWVKGVTGAQVGTTDARDAVQAIINEADRLTKS